jgi:hypothetical protein
MSEDLDSILEQCLSEIEEGRARPESFLVAYPELADELKPLLQAAVEMRSVPKPALAPEARDRIETQILEAAGANRRLRPARTWRLRIPAHWRWALVGLSAAIVLIFLFTMLVDAAAGIPPGSPLYPLKTATEDAWLLVTPAYAEPAVHLQLAERRLTEFEGLAEQGVYDPALLDAMIEQMESALAGTEGLSSSVALPVLEDLRGFSARQRQTLERFQTSAPGPLQNRLTTALQAGEGVDAQAEREMELRRSSREPPGQEQVPPGQEQVPPGQEQVPPGQEQVPPGQEQVPPGQEQVPPGQEQVPPGQEKVPPGQEKVPPGQEKVPPGQEKVPPDQQAPPGQEREPEPTKTPKP